MVCVGTVQCALLESGIHITNAIPVSRGASDCDKIILFLTHYLSYQPIRRPSLVDGHMRKYFSPFIKSERVTYSLAVVAFMILVVLCCVSLIFYLQYLVNSDAVPASMAPLGNAAVSILSAVQIILLNMYYSGLATDLNNQENHRYCVL